MREKNFFSFSFSIFVLTTVLLQRFYSFFIVKRLNEHG